MNTYLPRIRKLSIQIIRFFSILLGILFLVQNFLVSTYTFSSWYPLVFANSWLSSLAKIIIVVGVFYVFYFISKRLSYKKLIGVIVGLNILFFVVKIFVIAGFKNFPVADSWHIFNGTDVLHFTDDLRYLMKGNYFGTFPQQLGVVSLLFPITATFRFNIDGYFITFAVMMQLSILILSYVAYKFKGIEAAYWTSLLLNGFLPNVFVVFLVYGEIFAVFFLSLLVLVYWLYMRQAKQIYKIIYMLLMVFLVSLAYLARVSTNIYLLAFLSVAILMDVNFKSFLFKLSCVLLVLTLSYPINNAFYNKDNVQLGSYAIPFNTYLRIGIGYSGFDGVTPGYHDSQTDGDLKMFNYNPTLLSRYNSRIIENRWNKLIENNQLLDFYTQKLNIMWTDPDFEMMTLILPFAGHKFENPKVDSKTELYGFGALDLTVRTAFGQWLTNQYFTIRKAEKVFYFGILISMLFLFLKKDYKDPILMFARILTIGFFILHILIEIKSRYLFVYMDSMIFIVSLYLPGIFDMIELYMKRKLRK